MELNEAMRRRRWRGGELEPFAHYIGLRNLAPPRFFLDVRHKWLRQSYRESLHEVSVLHPGRSARQTQRQNDLETFRLSP
jgi:hypothetical protein